jgi:50S ribosomal protein L16 3-hydroxylase
MKIKKCSSFLLTIIISTSDAFFIRSYNHARIRQAHRSLQNTIYNIPDISLQSNFTFEFASSNSWGKSPLLIRNAFSEEAAKVGSPSSPWPSWDEIIELAENEDAETRLISHNPSDDHSWKLKLGPLDLNSDIPDDFWTIVVNDCDRFYSSLSDWVAETFLWIPQWRRDDAQISLANTGGGIGPHVDDYDVFLIQMKGTREWQVGKRKISIIEELKGLVKRIDVRVLDFWDTEMEKGLVETFILNPGDVLYLPPRFGHCGIATSQGCMTLSVGLRAPSAKDMMTNIMDTVASSIDGPFSSRYTDPDLLSTIDDDGNILVASNKIDSLIISRNKRLVRNAFNSLLDDDDLFYSFFGKLVTTTKRMRFDYPIALDELDHESRIDLGDWADATLAVTAASKGKGVLYAAEGTAWAYSLDKDLCKLFVDGKEWQIHVPIEDDNQTIALIDRIISMRQFNHDMLRSDKEQLPTSLRKALESLVFLGYLYGSDE